MRKYHNDFNTKQTKQTEVIPGRENDMHKNNAGGFSFTVDAWTRLERFLILGVESNTYYCSEQKLTKENAKSIFELIKTDGVKVVEKVVEISDQGRAYKNDPALFVLAMCAGADDVETRKVALEALPKVARIATHLFHFAEYVQAFRGWGKALCKGFANWYDSKEVDKLAFQIVKYRQRDGWTHKDIFRKAHPKTDDAVRNELYSYIVGKSDKIDELPAIIKGYETARKLNDPKKDTVELVALIKEYNLPRECIPTEMLNEVSVWEALFEKMPMNAMIRNLGKMTAINMVRPLTDISKEIVRRLGDQEYLKKSRVHPIQVLAAMMTYKAGRGVKGSLTWTPVQQVIEALDKAFYLTFDNVEPTNKNIMLAIDVSGSMTWSAVNGVPGLTPNVASAALALITASVEPNYHIFAFANDYRPLPIHKGMTLAEAIRVTEGISFGGTDCALPMQYAMEKDMDVDAFVVYTDGETWGGYEHPSQALTQYRKKSGRPAKLVCVAMEANKSSIADPADAGMMDICGFNTAIPTILSDFIKN